MATTERFDLLVNHIRNNTPIDELNIDLLKVSKKVEHIKNEECDMYNYIVKKNFFGNPTEAIIVGIDQSEIFSITIRSNNHEEYDFVEKEILNAERIVFVESKWNSKIYQVIGEDIQLQFGKNVHMNGDCVIGIFKSLYS